MTIKRMFINDVYGGDYTQYRRARKADYLKVQYEWSVYVDGLCKSGEITQRQYDTVVF